MKWPLLCHACSISPPGGCDAVSIDCGDADRTTRIVHKCPGRIHHLLCTPHSIILPPPGSPRENPNLPHRDPSNPIRVAFSLRLLHKSFQMEGYESEYDPESFDFEILLFLLCYFQGFCAPAPPRRGFFFWKKHVSFLGNM